MRGLARPEYDIVERCFHGVCSEECAAESSGNMTDEEERIGRVLLARGLIRSSSCPSSGREHWELTPDGVLLYELFRSNVIANSLRP